MFSRFHRLKTPLLLPLVMLLALSVYAQSAQAQKDPSPHSEAVLVAETRSVQPGTPFTVAMRLRMEPHWHSYWINPGDSGLPTSISWQLPAGFKAGEIVWPHPEKISTPPLITYGYENEVWLLTTITPPAQLPEKPVTLQAKAKWLICKDSCLPASTDLKLTLPVQNAPAEVDSRWTQGFAKTRAAVPTTDSGWKVRAENAATGKGFTLRLSPPAQGDAADWKAEEIYFFPAQASVIEHATPQKAVRQGDEFVLNLTPSEYAEGTPKRLSGILLAPEKASWNASGNRALAVDVPLEKAGSAQATGTAATSVPPSGGSGSTTLPIALALAFGGGLLLNLMPCVFPVLSLKILGFVQQSGEDKSRIKLHGFAFGAGVLLSFWVLAGVLLLLRAGGQSEAWGFQLQSPFFVAGLVILMFAVGLNLLGAFEVGVSLTRVSAPSATSHGGYAGSFWSGVLATIVATPCTAPFMGTALAFALTQPAVSALAVFTFLGIGMAAPYVILSLNPAWIKKLPRPGAWMETFKQLMAFPIFATALWLLTVFGLQTGVEGMAYLLGALLLLGAAVWAWRRWGGDTPKALPRNLARSGALLCTFLALGVAWNGAQLLPPEAAANTSGNKTAWQPYSAEKVEEHLAAGRPVFIDFTAAWCITCQVNKRVALAQPEVTQGFAERNVVLMRADWTRRDAEITRALEKYGRSGVPTYVLLKDREAKPQVLPEVLSQSVVLSALQEVGPRLAADAPDSQVK